MTFNTQKTTASHRFLIALAIVNTIIITMGVATLIKWYLQ